MKIIKLRWFEEANQDYKALDGHQKITVDKG